MLHFVGADYQWSVEHSLAAQDYKYCVGTPSTQTGVAYCTGEPQPPSDGAMYLTDNEFLSESTTSSRPLVLLVHGDGNRCAGRAGKHVDVASRGLDCSPC